MKRVAAVAIVVAVTAGGCGEGGNEHERALRAAITTTRLESRAFVYRFKSADIDMVISGLIEDDYRYKARIDIDGAPAFEEVVADDAIAMRFADPRRLGASPLATRDLGTVQALSSGRWVLDAEGAPDVIRRTADRAARNPVLEALDVLGYVERTIKEVPVVEPFNPESLEYRANEDPFPAPERGSGVRRYDFRTPDLPRSGGNQPTALGARRQFETRNFRRLAVYVKDGRVLEVREAVFIASRQLKDIARFYNIKLSGTLAEQTQQALTAMNATRTGVGSDPIYPRAMSLQVLDVGKVRRVALPKNAIAGRLPPDVTRSRAQP